MSTKSMEKVEEKLLECDVVQQMYTMHNYWREILI